MEEASISYAKYLGIDIEVEQELIVIATQALNKLPKNWVVGFGEPDSEHPGVPYFYNELTEESSWHHPKEDIYFQLVDQERERLATRKKTNALNSKNKEKSTAPPLLNDIMVFDMDDSTTLGVASSSLDKDRERERNRGDQEGGRGREKEKVRENEKVKEKDRERERTSWKDEHPRGKASSTRERGRESDREKDKEKEKDKSSRSSRDRERERDGRDYDDKGYERSSSRSLSRKEASTTHERERERESSSIRRGGDESSLYEEIRILTSVNKDLEIELRDVRTAQDSKFQTMRAAISSADLKAEGEREERRSIEEKMFRMKLDYDDDYERKLREATKKIRADMEEEWRDRLKGTEKRLLEEIEHLKIDLTACRRRADEAERDAEGLRKKAYNHQDTGMSEMAVEFDNAQRAQLELEESLKQSKSELKKLRDEHIGVSERLAVTLQAWQVSSAEAETARTDAKIAITDSQVIHTALVQATQRLHDSDLEAVKLRGENVMLKEHLERKLTELKKIEGAKEMSGERLNITELDNRRQRTKFDGEISRLSSRVTELEVTNSVLQDQLSRTENQDISTARNLERTLDKKDFDLSRLKDRLNEAEVRCETHIKRIATLEKELSNGQDLLFSKDLLLKDEQQKTEMAEMRVEDVRRRLEGEVSTYRQQLHDERLKLSEQAQKHVQEVEVMRRDVEMNIPLIAEAAADKVEKAWGKRMQTEINSLRMRYESEIDGMRKEILELNASHAEKDARRRVQLAEEKAELGSLRRLCVNLKHQMDASPQDSDEAARGTGYNDENRDISNVAAFPAVAAAYGYSTAPRNRGARANNTGYTESRVSKTMEKQVQQQLQEAANTAAFHALQTQLHSMQYKLSSSLNFQVTPAFSSSIHFPINGRQSPLGVSTIRREKYENIFSSPQPASAGVSRIVYDEDRIDSSFVSRVDVSHHDDVDLNTNTKRTSFEDGFAAIQDGGFHAGYWKAKYLGEDSFPLKPRS